MFTWGPVVLQHTIANTAGSAAVASMSGATFLACAWGGPIAGVVLHDIVVKDPKDSYARSIVRGIGEGLQTFGLMATAASNASSRSGHQSAAQTAPAATQAASNGGFQSVHGRPPTPYPNR